MKTAEDYSHEVCCALTKCGAGLSYIQERYLKSIIEETLPPEQLDALKEGMRRAADITTMGKTTYGVAYNAILTAAEQLTEKDLQ